MENERSCELNLHLYTFHMPNVLNIVCLYQAEPAYSITTTQSTDQKHYKSKMTYKIWTVLQVGQSLDNMQPSSHSRFPYQTLGSIYRPTPALDGHINGAKTWDGGMRHTSVALIFLHGYGETASAQEVTRRSRGALPPTHPQEVSRSDE